jgi:hypothetical protein
MSNDSHDWLAASNEDRKALYKASKRVIDTAGLTWDELYVRAIGRNPLRGIGYEDNFRAGKISRSYASCIYRWIAEFYPEHLQSLDAALSASGKAELEAPKAKPGDTWLLFLQERASGSGLSVMPPRREVQARLLNIDDGDNHNSSTITKRRVFADTFNARNPLVRVRLGDAFYFMFQTIAVGRVVTLSEYRHNWTPERVTESGDAPIFTDGENVIPSLNNEPRPLIEYDDVGLHRFVFIVVDGGGALRHTPRVAMGQAIPLRELDALADELSALPLENLRVFQVSILFS